MGIEDNVIKCLQDLCSGYMIKRISCGNLDKVDHGIYVIIIGNDYLVGYSRDLGRKLRMYCLGRLDVYGVTRLLMSRLGDLSRYVLGTGSVIDRRREFTKMIINIMSNAQIITIKCGSTSDKELYVRLKDCLSKARSPL